MTDDDAKLWSKVTATVKGGTAPVVVPEFSSFVEVDQRYDRTNVAVTVRTERPRKLPVSRTTLDLHGLTVQEAYDAARAFVEGSGRRSSVTIVTGKSGQIRQEFERWMQGMAKVHSVTVKSGGGAFTVRVLKTYR